MYTSSHALDNYLKVCFVHGNWIIRVLPSSLRATTPSVTPHSTSQTVPNDLHRTYCNTSVEIVRYAIQPNTAISLNRGYERECLQ